ncbi:MAG: hypothetical protein QM762_09405 [Chryseolinea sp.]
MKRILPLLLCICLLGVMVNAQDRTPYQTKSLSGDKISSVFARTSGGNIMVSGVSASEARIEVYVSSGNKNTLSNEEISKRLKEDYDLTVAVEGNKLVATAEPKHSFSNWKQQLNVSYKIYVPSEVSTDLGTSGGGIDLKNLKGSQNFSTSGGGLTLAQISGKVRGKTSGGNISLKDCKDDLVLSTSGGGIQAENCSGEIRLNTSGGTIDLEGLNGEIEAETSGGSVRGENIRGNLYARTSGGTIKMRGISCGLDASTSGGSIDVEINEVVAAVTLNNSGGNVNLKMPSSKGLNLRLRGDKISVVDLKNFTGDQDDNSITGKVNGGGIAVNVSTNGNLTFALK